MTGGIHQVLILHWVNPNKCTNMCVSSNKPQPPKKKPILLSLPPFLQETTSLSSPKKEGEGEPLAYHSGISCKHLSCRSNPDCIMAHPTMVLMVDLVEDWNPAGGMTITMSVHGVRTPCTGNRTTSERLMDRESPAGIRRIKSFPSLRI